tara:strand:- start:25748 stop:25876 length:129 start_codon:yes stop_codon:yes gene_type:complete
MARSKPKKEKKQETIEEFVARMAKSPTRSAGLKKNNLKGSRH